MPICQVCNQREATVFFTQIINGKKTDMYVCSQCAGADEGYKIDLNTLLSGLLGLSAEAQEVKVGSQNQCDRCGMTIEEFNATGKMGCSRCYEVFFEPMQALLKRIQGNTRHHGKVPEKFAMQHAAESEIEKLKEELAGCIRTEAYERAAVIRDKIRELEHEGGDPA